MDFDSRPLLHCRSLLVWREVLASDAWPGIDATMCSEQPICASRRPADQGKEGARAVALGRQGAETRGDGTKLARRHQKRSLIQSDGL
jgi:hypothetical protein